MLSEHEDGGGLQAYRPAYKKLKKVLFAAVYKIVSGQDRQCR